MENNCLKTLLFVPLGLFVVNLFHHKSPPRSLLRSFWYTALHFSPVPSVIANPIKQCSFESDILSQSLRFQPLVFQNLFSLGQKLLVQTGSLQDVALVLDFRLLRYGFLNRVLMQMHKHIHLFRSPLLLLIIIYRVILFSCLK